MKTPVIETGDFTAYYDQYEDKTFLHCDVFRYNKRVKNDLHAALKLLVALRRTPLFAIHETGDLKHLKFLSMLGFKYVETRNFEDTKLIEIYMKEVI